MAKKKTTAKDSKAAKINPDLDGLSVNINSLGEVVTSYDIDKLNQFLNENVDDKKLRDRPDSSDSHRNRGDEETPAKKPKTPKK
ncbi:MAG: hypothetical protein K0R51_2038 [Cytophagaceae bacterium]|jgi:hypothetical protein|nr:hypothetical protein [Cytophagaceae bacterium]